MRTIEALARTYNDEGVMHPRGSLVIRPINGMPGTFSATLHDHGRDIKLPTIQQGNTRNRHYALLAKGFAMAAERT